MWSVRHTGSFRRCRTNLASSMKSDKHWSQNIQNWLQPICFQPIADMKRNQTRMHKVFTVFHALSFTHPDFGAPGSTTDLPNFHGLEPEGWLFTCLHARGRSFQLQAALGFGKIAWCVVVQFWCTKTEARRSGMCLIDVFDAW